MQGDPSNGFPFFIGAPGAARQFSVSAIDYSRDQIGSAACKIAAVSDVWR